MWHPVGEGVAAMTGLSSQEEGVTSSMKRVHSGPCMCLQQAAGGVQERYSPCLRMGAELTVLAGCQGASRFMQKEKDSRCGDACLHLTGEGPIGGAGE